MFNELLCRSKMSLSKDEIVVALALLAKLTAYEFDDAHGILVTRGLLEREFGRLHLAEAGCGLVDRGKPFVFRARESEVVIEVPIVKEK